MKNTRIRWPLPVCRSKISFSILLSYLYLWAGHLPCKDFIPEPMKIRNKPTLSKTIINVLIIFLFVAHLVIDHMGFHIGTHANGSCAQCEIVQNDPGDGVAVSVPAEASAYNVLPAQAQNFTACGKFHDLQKCSDCESMQAEEKRHIGRNVNIDSASSRSIAFMPDRSLALQPVSNQTPGLRRNSRPTDVLLI